MSIRVMNMMKKAYERRILVPAFNAAYPEMVKPICDTLKRLKTFGMLEISRPDITKFGAISFTAMFKEYKKHADPEFVPIHQDHVPVIDEDNIRIDYMSLINEAVGLGYDSVMIDGSRLSLEENIRITKEVVSIAHKKNIPVEAELGAVLGHESGPIPPYEELFKTGKGFTDPGDAERFAKETGVDWLSVAVGNIHGAITGAAKDAKKLSARINIEHLKKLQKVTRIPTVLHGGSGIGKEYILQAVKEGLTKINIGTEIRQAYEKGLKGSGSIENAQKETSRSMEYLITDYFGIKGSKDLLDR
jgi:ketose-bisphosphate aldolase